MVMILPIAVCPEPILLIVIGMSGDLVMGGDLFDMVRSDVLLIPSMSAG